MDRQEVAYSEAKYNEVKEDLTKLLKNVGFKLDTQITFIPISAFKDDNINKASPNMPWFKGPTLLQALDNLKVPEKPTDKPLRLPVQDVYTITGIGTVPVGRVETGKLKVGDKIIFLPSGEVGRSEVDRDAPRVGPGSRSRATTWGSTSAASTRTTSGAAMWRGPVSNSADGGRELHREHPGAEPPERHHGRVHAGVPLPHGAGRLRVHRAPEAPRPEDGPDRRRRTPRRSRPGTPRSCDHPEAPAGHREVQRVPPARPLCGPRHGSDRRRRASSIDLKKREA